MSLKCKGRRYQPGGQGGARLRDTFPDAGRHTQSLRGAIRLVEGGRAMENSIKGDARKNREKGAA